MTRFTRTMQSARIVLKNAPHVLVIDQKSKVLPVSRRPLTRMGGRHQVCTRGHQDSKNNTGSIFFP